MYAQKIRKPNISLPRSWKCSVLISLPTRPARLKPSVSRMTTANEVTAEAANTRTPNMVEYQPGSSDMIQSKPAKVSESANKKVAGAAKALSLFVYSLSPVASCAVE